MMKDMKNPARILIGTVCCLSLFSAQAVFCAPDTPLDTVAAIDLQVQEAVSKVREEEEAWMFRSLIFRSRRTIQKNQVRQTAGKRRQKLQKRSALRQLPHLWRKRRQSFSPSRWAPLFPMCLRKQTSRRKKRKQRTQRQTTL